MNYTIVVAFLCYEQCNYHFISICLETITWLLGDLHLLPSNGESTTIRYIVLHLSFFENPSTTSVKSLDNI